MLGSLSLRIRTPDGLSLEETQDLKRLFDLLGEVVSNATVMTRPSEAVPLGNGALSRVALMLAGVQVLDPLDLPLLAVSNGPEARVASLVLGSRRPLPPVLTSDCGRKTCGHIHAWCEVEK